MVPFSPRFRKRIPDDGRHAAYTGPTLTRPCAHPSAPAGLAGHQSTCASLMPRKGHAPLRKVGAAHLVVAVSGPRNVDQLAGGFLTMHFGGPLVPRRVTAFRRRWDARRRAIRSLHIRSYTLPAAPCGRKNPRTLRLRLRCPGAASDNQCGENACGAPQKHDSQHNDTPETCPDPAIFVLGLIGQHPRARARRTSRRDVKMIGGHRSFKFRLGFETVRRHSDRAAAIVAAPTLAGILLGNTQRLTARRTIKVNHEPNTLPAKGPLQLPRAHTPVVRPPTLANSRGALPALTCP